MTFDSYVQSVTQDHIVPSVVDGILNGNVLAMRLLGNGKRWDGEALKRPFMYQANSSQGSYSGFDLFSTAQVKTRILLSFDPRAYYQSVVLSNMDLSVNATQSRVLDLLKVEMETAKISMTDAIGALIYGDGTGNSNKDFLGLAAAVDDGTVVGTYGGQSRTTYSQLNASVTASVGALTLSAMNTSYFAAKVGADKPTIMVCDESVWSYYEALLTPTIRANYDSGGYPQVTKAGVAPSKLTLRGEVGFDALYYRGTPLVADEKCTSGYLYFLNETYLKWYGLKHAQHGEVKVNVSEIESGAMKEETPMFGLAWTGLKEPVNQDAEIGQFLLLGNLVCWNPRTQAVMKGVTS